MRPSRKLQRYLEENPKFAAKVGSLLRHINLYSGDRYTGRDRVEKVIGAARKLDQIITGKRKELAR